jgi:hypothetical protein
LIRETSDRSGMAARDANRREFLMISGMTILIGALAKSSAWAGGRPAAMDAWARQVVGLKDDLLSGRIGVADWQSRIELLNRSVPLAELTAYLDIDGLTRDFKYPSLLADIANPVLPPDIVGEAGMKRWFVRIFGMRQGGAIIPHVHNEMVSAHLVVSGSFRARTHDRIRDLSDAVVLRQTRDAELTPGEIISMSDKRDNQHWLVAKENRSITFDVGIVDVPASWSYGLKANEYNMIFVDPTNPPQSDGTIVAPILTFEQAKAKFAA